MTNLLKSKPRIFKKQLSEREVYETERYYLLKVVDISGCLENELRQSCWKLDIETFLEKLFESQQNGRLNKAVYKFLDEKRLNIDCTLEEVSTGRSIAVIIIRKKSVRERLKEVFEKYVHRIFDVENNDDF